MSSAIQRGSAATEAERGSVTRNLIGCEQNIGDPEPVVPAEPLRLTELRSEKFAQAAKTFMISLLGFLSAH